MAAQDAAALKELFAPRVNFRALTPGRVWESDDADAVVDEVDPRHVVLAGSLDHPGSGGRVCQGRPSEPGRLPVRGAATRRLILSSSNRRTSGPKEQDLVVAHTLFGVRPMTNCRRSGEFNLADQRNTWLEAALSAWGGLDRDNPFPLFAEVRELGPVHHVTLADGHEAWLVVGYDEARLALNDPRISKDMRAALARDGAVVAEGLPGPEFARHMLAVDPPDHTRLRRLVSSAFSMRTVEGLRPRVQAHRGRPPRRTGRARYLMSPVDLVADFAFPLPFTVICELLGVPESERASLGHGLVAMLVPTPTRLNTPKPRRRPTASCRSCDGWSSTSTTAPGDDLVSGLIAARDGDERLDTQELLSTIFQLIVAGHDTTTTFIGNAVVALLEQPRSARRSCKMIPTGFRRPWRSCCATTRPCPTRPSAMPSNRSRSAAISIPPGAQIIVCLAAANRDPCRFAEPGRLDVERAEGRHLAFGHGIHHCLGAPLARLEGQLALGSLIRRFPRAPLGGERAGLHWGHGDGLVLRGLSELPVRLGPALPR